MAVLAALLCGCVELEPEERFGLETVYLSVTPDDLARVQQGSYSKTRAGVDIQLEGQWRVGALSIAGESSVDDAKTSFNLDLDAPLHGRTRWRLDAMSRDPTALTGALAYRVFGRAGFEVPSPHYVAVFLNGDYLGLYTLHETLDGDFFAARGDTAVSLYAAQKTLGAMESTAHLDRAFASRVGEDTYADLRELIAIVNDPPSAETHRQLERILDVDSVLRYMAVTAYIDNSDGVNNNYTLVRTEQAPRFAILPWDLDFSFRRTWAPDDGALFDRNALMRRLFAEPAHRQRYACHLAELATIAPAEQLAADLATLAADIEQARAADPILGRDPTPPAERQASIDARNRTQQALTDTSPLCAED